MKIINKDKLSDLMKLWNKNSEVIAPSVENGNLRFVSFDSIKPTLEFKGRPMVSPKEFLFPQREKILTFDTSDKVKVAIKSHPNDMKRIIWGVRPCDLKGIETLDTIFLSNYLDNYYEIRRKNTILMGLNCNEPCETCFCNSCDSGPFADSGFDILFTDLGDSYLVASGSKVGEEIIAKHPEFFKQATDADKEKAKSLEETSRKGFKRSIVRSVVKQRLPRLPQFWENALWEEESAPCMLCGGCNFVCPTCHCFNIEDTVYNENVSTRVRYWDSCQLGGFTQMAAENTRRTQKERLRQRIFHKFVYTPDKYNDATGCTGCGRCIEVCPAEIDITHILGRITRNG